jgi:putative tryptophan/tyrosine transport system substrate-binding protein
MLSGMQFDQMKRRELIALVGSAAAAYSVSWSRDSQAQQTGKPVIGLLNGQYPADVARYVAAFRESLKEAGFVEGQNVAIEYRYADGRRDRIAALAAELVRLGVNVIFTGGGTPVTVAAKSATATIPIVFTMGGDPVQLGIVAALNRPGGNATGACYFFNTLGPKRLELLREIVPSAKVIGYLVNPTNPSLEAETGDMHAAMRSLGLEFRDQHVRNTEEIDVAFASFAQQQVDAIVAAADVLFIVQRDQLAALAARYRLPTSYHAREIVAAGGLMCYGPSQLDAYRQGGIYTARILKGEKPADLPVVQSTKFEFVLNLRTAKTLGLTAPPTLLAIADEVIE